MFWAEFTPRRCALVVVGTSGKGTSIIQKGLLIRKSSLFWAEKGMDVFLQQMGVGDKRVVADGKRG